MKYFDHVKAEDAQWAADLTAACPKTTGVSTRLLHYLAVSEPQHKKPDGTVYANTLSDCNFLRNACEHAQYLGLVPYQILADCNDLSIPQNAFSPGRVPSHRQWIELFKQMFDRFCISYVRCMAAKLSPVHIEIWLENSMAASVISPIAGKYNVNLIASHRSIPTAVIFQFIRRACHTSVPIRIFHLSDFDPTNINRPARITTRLNMLLERFKLRDKHDLKIRHLMLNRQQCTRFNLPAEPCDANTSSPKVELYALEALCPGYINKTLEHNLKRYIDLSAVKKTMSITQTALKQILPPISRIIDSNTSIAAAMRKAEKQMSQN